MKSIERQPAAVERSTLLVGGIDYLNALPLTEYLTLDGDPPLELKNLVPSALSQGLRSGELDIALVPAVEYLEDDRYRIVPEICISSYGAVESIRFYYRRPFAELKRVGLDTSSRTSAMLTRLFFRLLWKGQPEFLELSPSLLEAFLSGQEDSSAPPVAECPDDLDAVLLIGDSALRRGAPAGWKQTDLGNEWTRWTGLPFVYAFWVWRGPEPAPTGLVERFQRGKNVGLSHIDDIVRRWCAAANGTSELIEECRCRDYLSRAIQYDFGPIQQEGLLHFYSLLKDAGLHSGAPRRIRNVETNS